ncbi:regulatory protein, luxR family [Limimonas halophila]|uniref:Regulatory protein, luxR family n=1 Tax=Limimonas halophila TaxID=1082479 RepID=A0A1G7RFX7_9PROT|nr:helix-turn-helix transcriptional regulator [Limimonas halophila]SDG09668.1 regulatory protein, luxR family [Limimonas halophila]
MDGISYQHQPTNADIEQSRERAIAQLRETYGLTRQEARIGTLVGEGHVIRDAARDLGIQESTARWHLKNVFSKLDIHRQVELVRLIMHAEAR